MGKFGFTQVWTNDNLEYRSVLASSAAIVARLPVKLGTAVTVPYFRNPVDLAMAFATMSELMDGREISLGWDPDRDRYRPSSGTGEAARDHGELATALRTLFAGATLSSSDMPVLASYFHMNAQQYALRFKTQSPIRLYYGPSLLKPAVLDLISRHFDGVILQTLYGIADMEASLARLQAARAQSPLGEPLRKVMLLNASVSRDGEAARQQRKDSSHISFRVGRMMFWRQKVSTRGCSSGAKGLCRESRRRSRGCSHAG